MFQRRKITTPREGRIPPFRIFGNVYFVGSHQASSHLIHTGDGLILIDTGYAENSDMIRESVLELGFALEDIRYIVHTHWHVDHTEATKELVALSGAKTLIGKEDARKVQQFFIPDILLSDGDTLTLGNTTISFMETPGHTKGTLSLFFYGEENGKIFRLGMFGGAGANTLQQGRFDYENCRQDYRASLQRLQKEKVDIFLGNHVWNNDTEGKQEALLKGEGNPFIDPALWNRFLTFCEKRLDEVIQKDA